MSDQMARHHSLRVYVAAAAGVAATAAVLWLLALGLLPLGLAGEWAWPWRTFPIPLSAGVIVTVLAMLLAATVVLDAARGPRVRRGPVYVALPVLVIAGSQLPLQLLGAETGGWQRAIVATCSDPTTGYLTQAVHITDLRAWLRDLRQRTDMTVTPSRVATHPPGPVLFFRWWIGLVREHPSLQRVAGALYSPEWGAKSQVLRTARRVCTAPITGYHMDAALLSVYLLALAVPFVVMGVLVLARAQVGGRVALTATVLASAVPALHVFVPSIDPWAAALAVWSLAFWALALRRDSVLWALLAGLVWGAGLQWTYGLAALAVFLVLDAARCRPRKLAALAGALAGGLMLAHLPLMALGYNPAASFVASMATQRQIMQDRSYLPWVGLNAWDLALFAGPALIALASVAVGQDERPTLLPVVVTLAILLLAGSTRGEVGRIWGFLMPLAAVPAGHVLCRTRESLFLLAGGLVLGAQIAMVAGLSSRLLLVSY